MLRFAEQVVKAKLCQPADTAATVAMKLQAGAELGFSPMQALSVMTSINGRVGIMGTGALAKLRSSELLAEQIRMGIDGDGDKRTAWVETRRKGDEAKIRTEFSILEAKRAGLWGKAGPWTQYPDDMLQWRAVGRHCKRHWSDVLLGVDIAETIDVIPITALPVRAEAGPDPLLGGLVSRQDVQKALLASDPAIEYTTTTVLEMREDKGRAGVVCADGNTYGLNAGHPLVVTCRSFVGTGEQVQISFTRRGKILDLVDIEAAEQPEG